MSYKSTTPNKILMEQARQSISENKLWGVGAGLLATWFALNMFMSVIIPSDSALNMLFTYILAGPVSLTFAYMGLSISRQSPISYDKIVFSGFNHRAGAAIAGYLLTILIAILLFMGFVMGLN